MLKTDNSPNIVSVVVPIYNAEKYLSACLDSILNQTYTKIEIILVDDKSKDDSIKIAQKYTKKDSRIKLISKEINQGINQSRKTGFENATGEYIMFVDDDDIISENLIKDHLEALSDTGADISISKAFWWNENDIIDMDGVYERGGSGDVKVLSKKLAYRSLITEASPFSDTEVGMLWNKLHKRSYFEGYDWSLSNMPSEDFMTNARLLAEVEAVVYIDRVHYFHRVSSASTMGQLSRKRGANTEQAIDIFDALLRVSEIFSEVARSNGWDFEKEIMYFKYRYFYIRMEAFTRSGSFTEADYEKIKQYSSKNELDLLFSNDFERYIAEYVYFPANIILPTLVEYWRSFVESSTVAEFLERRIRFLTENVQKKDMHIGHIESIIHQRDQELREIQSLRGSLFNFLGKIKHRIILRVFYALRSLNDRRRVVRLEKKYKDCWIVMDRVENASDNGYAFYEYLLKNHPDINAFFAINKDSIDVPRLQEQGFKLVFVGTEEHDIAVKESSNLFYAYFTFEYANKTARRIFLGHGITKDDLPNPGIRSSDYFITTLDREQDFLSERVDMTAVKIGQPRYERLMKIKEVYRGEKDKIVIAPTWRSWLYHESGASMSDEYFVGWQQFLKSKELKELSGRYEVVFILHPMMVEAGKKNNTDYFDIPKYIKSTKYNILGLDSLQDLLVRTNLLITDYSSIAFDATIAGSTVVYFQFDERAFRIKGQLKQGWFDYMSDGLGPVFSSYDDLIEYIYNYDGKCNKTYQLRAEQLRDDVNNNVNASEELVRLGRNL